MTQIILDPDLRNKLNNLQQPVELCDESGKVLARVIPVSSLDPADYIAVEKSISEEELQRRRSEKEYSTSEVLAHLENL